MQFGFPRDLPGIDKLDGVPEAEFLEKFGSHGPIDVLDASAHEN
jgi:hypothetical protein